MAFKMAARQVILHQNAFQSPKKWQHNMLQRLLVVCDNKNNVLIFFWKSEISRGFIFIKESKMAAIALEWL